MKFWKLNHTIGPFYEMVETIMSSLASYIRSNRKRMERRKKNYVQERVECEPLIRIVLFSLDSFYCDCVEQWLSEIMSKSFELYSFWNPFSSTSHCIAYITKVLSPSFFCFFFFHRRCKTPFQKRRGNKLNFVRNRIVEMIKRLKANAKALNNSKCVNVMEWMPEHGFSFGTQPNAHSHTLFVCKNISYTPYTLPLWLCSLYSVSGRLEFALLFNVWEMWSIFHLNDYCNQRRKKNRSDFN